MEPAQINQTKSLLYRKKDAHTQTTMSSCTSIFACVRLLTLLSFIIE